MSSAKEIFKIYSLVEDKSLIKDLTPVFVGSFLTIYSLLLITDGYYFLVFLVVGFALGAFYFNNTDGNLKIERFERNLFYEEQILEQFSNTTDPVKEVELFYPPLTTVVNQLLDHVMRDFISSWWTPLNTHKDPTFEKLARERLNIVFLNVQKILLNQDRNDIVMSTVYGVANTLIIHMRECRELENSGLSMNHYMVENPNSPFSQLLSREEQHKQLRGLTQTFLKRTLPPQDMNSLLMVSLIKELLATYVFGGILDNFSEPDFLNEWIVHLLSEKTSASEAIASTISAAVIAEENREILTEEPVIIQHPEDENISMSSSNSTLEHVTPPDTPELQKRAIVNKLPPPSSTTSLIFPKGSVNFTIMDISAPQENEQSPNKTELVYIIQIERPAMEDHGGSEGGGYVITRTYADFESLNIMLHARHARRVAKLQVRLPLDATKGWLKSSTQQKKKKVRLDAMSPLLEKYIDTVVQDVELGTDPVILPFLRKERRSEIDDGGAVVSFAEEYKEETAAALGLLTSSSPSGSRSLFSRNSTSSTLAVNSQQMDEAGSSCRASMDAENNTKWFAAKARTGSFSSLHSSFSHNIDTEEELSPVLPAVNLIQQEETPSRKNTPSMQPNKALSAMDVELLIETTYALIVEIFNLTTSNNKAWMRRSILNLLREIVRRTYAEFIAEQYNDFVNEYMSPDAIVSVLNKMGEQFWPDGKWMLHGQEPAHKKTAEDKQRTSQLARSLLMTEMIPNAVRQLIGDQNCNTAMDRIWARIQDPELNRVLILQVLERIIKPILG